MSRIDIIQETLNYPGSVKALSYYDLAYLILMAAYNAEPSQQEKYSIHNSVLKALDNHWRNSDILNLVTNRVLSGQPSPTSYLNPLIASVNTDRGRNLIDINKTYYHLAMLITPPPVSYTWDYNSGEFIGCQDEYYCENRCEVTISDICDYFIAKSVRTYCIKETYYDTKLILGIINNWTQRTVFDVDQLFFAIDGAINSNEQAPIKSFADVNKYIHQAAETIKGKQEALMSSMKGDVQFVIPRRRQLLY